MNVALALEDFHEGIEAQIAARRNQAFFAGGHTLVVLIPRSLVVAGFGECGANGLLNAHARRGITLRLTAATEIGAFGIFTKCELDSRKRPVKRKLGGRLAPAQLYDYGLTADRVGAAVQDVSGGHTANEVAVN